MPSEGPRAERLTFVGVYEMALIRGQASVKIDCGGALFIKDDIRHVLCWC